MRWVLVALCNGELRTHPLAAGEALLGRDLDCDVVLDHHRVSRRHARLCIPAAGDAFAIEDLGSRSGTRLGEAIKPNQPGPLRPGDPIGIGPFALTVVRAAALPSTALVIEDPDATALPPALLPVARSAVHVLLRGESGAGMQVLAEALHRLSGRRGRFIKVDCAGLAPEVLQVELFGGGPEPGALAAAGEGTVLLDEVGALPPALQLELARALDRAEAPRAGTSQPVAAAARLICATQRNLLELVEAGAFRLELYYRLAGATVAIRPPAVGLPPGEEAERRKIYDALDQCGGNQTRAARLLGISRGALAMKLSSYRPARTTRARR